MLLPAREQHAGSAQALEGLFAAYRRPIVEFIRPRVRNPDDAEDLAHDFIARLLERDDLARLTPAGGRFRHFLTAAIRNYLANHYNALDAQKRKGLCHPEPADLDSLAGKEDSLDRQFLQAWWRSTIDEAIRRLREEWRSAGQEALFDDLEPFLWEKNGARTVPEVSARHGLTPNAIYVRLSRMRERYRAVLRTVVRETVGSDEEVEEEIRCILQV